MLAELPGRRAAGGGGQAEGLGSDGASISGLTSRRSEQPLVLLPGEQPGQSVRRGR